MEDDGKLVLIKSDSSSNLSDEEYAKFLTDLLHELFDKSLNVFFTNRESESYHSCINLLILKLQSKLVELSKICVAIGDDKSINKSYALKVISSMIALNIELYSELVEYKLIKNG